MNKETQKTLVLVGSGIAGASISQGATALLPDKFKTPVYKGILAAACTAAAVFMPGKGNVADAGRGALIGAAVIQARDAIVTAVKPNVTTTNKFVQGMLNGASAYEEYDYGNAYAQPEVQTYDAPMTVVSDNPMDAVA